MDKIIAYANLPFSFDSVQAWEEVKTILSNEKQHFNTAHYTGEWTAISLRSPGGKADNILPDIIDGSAFTDTELMHYCPTIEALVRSFQCSVMSVRILNLKKGAVIKEHRDAGLSFEKGEARLHFPLATNSKVEFFVEGNRVIMNNDECWYINANLPHRVANFGETDRIHLVIDCVVNEWLANIFNRAEVTYAKQPTKASELQMIVKELRALNTETSNKLANELESGITSTNA